ncbi:MAG: SCO family protein [Gammaproteobacteria bacterium]|nr:SCO family protein [Gammaproteobacteria bacterium]
MIKSSQLYRAVATLFFLFLIAVIWNIASQSSSPPQELMGVLRAEPRQLNSFELINQKGQLINESLFEDKWSFVFFGYTSCPDICPTTLHTLNSVMDRLGKEHVDIFPDTQIIFVSVDPERDTVDSLTDYVTFFNKDFIGLTGDKKNIDNFTQSFGAGYMMGQEISPGEYLVAHTSAIFLVAPDTKVMASFSQPHIPETIVSLYKKIRFYTSK